MRRSYATAPQPFSAIKFDISEKWGSGASHDHVRTKHQLTTSKRLAKYSLTERWELVTRPMSKCRSCGSPQPTCLFFFFCVLRICASHPFQVICGCLIAPRLLIRSGGWCVRVCLSVVCSKRVEYNYNMKPSYSKASGERPRNAISIELQSQSHRFHDEAAMMGLPVHPMTTQPVSSYGV